MRKIQNTIALKEAELDKLNRESIHALDIVTSTINQLGEINSRIDIKIAEIDDDTAKLKATQEGLITTKEHNNKIIEKFKNLIS